MSPAPTTFIYEFAHPRLVVNYHTGPASGPFRMAHVDEALALAVHSLELDLRLRAADGAVACGHDRVTAASPTLAAVVDRVLARKGTADTVNDDDRQFFLVLEPKQDSTALYDGLFATLGNYESVLGTAVSAEDRPRPLTAVLTGAFRRQCHGYLYALHGDEVNRRLVAENVDYDGLVANLSRGRGTFQWTTFRYADPAGNGRVSGLHAGTDARLGGRFNLRVWDTKTDEALALAVASCADAVNCEPDAVARFEESLLHQEPHGLAPHLAVRDGRALLTWQGADGALWTSIGRLNASGLSFARQIDAVLFAAGEARAEAPAGLLPPGGGILVAYNRTGESVLHYLSGRFTSPDRFVTFDGREYPLGPAEPGLAGTAPSAAIAPDGRVLLVYAADGARLRYFSGFLSAAGQLLGTDYELSRGTARRGSTPSVAIDATGRVVVVYEGTREHRLWSVSGTIDDAGRIQGDEHQLPGAGSRPAVALDEAGRFVVAYQAAVGGALRYVSGGRDFDLGVQGTRPTVALVAGRAAVVYRGTGGELRYVHGTIGADGRIAGRDRVVIVSLDRR